MAARATGFFVFTASLDTFYSPLQSQELDELSTLN